MEERYWELREECERTFDRWVANKNEPNFQAYRNALSIYQDFCMDVLERLMDENADVLKNLKDQAWQMALNVIYFRYDKGNEVLQ